VSKGYRFGPFRLDATRRRLIRDGDSVSVPPKALDVLEVLLENRGRTVDKEDLVARVWPDTVVEDANLTQSIFLLRRALGDDPADPRYISTVARRGYRFVGSASDEMTASAPEDRSRVHRTVNVNAYHAYLKGRHYWSKRNSDGVRAAIRCFRQAIDLDPTYASAYVGLAECYVSRWVHGWTTAADAIVTAKAAAGRALDIDDTIAEAHAAIGVLRMMAERDWSGAEKSFLCAIELAPDYATTRNWYANYLVALGRFDEAVREAQHAVELDPLNVSWRMGVGHMLLLARRHAEAVEQELNVIEMDSQFWLAHWVLGMAYDQLGDVPRAVVALQRADDFSGGNPIARGVLGRALALSGRVDEGRGILQDITLRNAREEAPADAVGIVYAGLGNLDAAFDWFERAAREGSYLLSFLNVSPLFDSFRSHERFSTLQRLMRLA
jgi:DNA-binding winged helix-turn-helix (wHTH) protein/cytochrome c-type biogenesis protein CcmH/NrfG